VACVDGHDREIDASYCRSSPADKNGTGAAITDKQQPPPASHKPCNLGTCPFWRAKEWTGVRLSFYVSRPTII